MEQQEKCYFCETDKQVNEKLYIFNKIDERYIPVQVNVCTECKKEYEETFPEY